MSNNDPWWLRTHDVDTSWMIHGLCRQVDPDLFFPDQGSGITRRAKSVCRRCPVMDECREYAMLHPGIIGIWGATTQKERSDLRVREEKAA